jgi:conjugative relaxase-like TrwC/TraI family protein
VAEAQLEAIFGRALHPGTGTRLSRAWRADGVTGFDLTFSAPKSVSVLWALGGVTAATEVDAAHRAAVIAALTYLDLNAALSRTGTDGVEQITTEGLVAALFDHRTSRAGDPQLHTHALVPNKLLCVDGVWRTIDGHEIYHHKKAAGAIYQAALRAELTARLGVLFGEVNAHGQAEILGVPDELMEAWSKRTADIMAEADPVIAEYEAILGRELTAAERGAVVKTAVLKTRTGKELPPSLAVLRQQWRTEAATLGWDAVTLHNTLSSAAAARLAAGGDNKPSPDFYAAAVTAAGARHGVFSVADLTAQVAARLPAGLARTAEQARFPDRRRNPDRRDRPRRRHRHPARRRAPRYHDLRCHPPRVRPTVHQPASPRRGTPHPGRRRCRPPARHRTGTGECGQRDQAGRVGCRPGRRRRGDDRGWRPGHRFDRTRRRGENHHPRRRRPQLAARRLPGHRPRALGAGRRGTQQSHRWPDGHAGEMAAPTSPPHPTTRHRTPAIGLPAPRGPHRASPVNPQRTANLERSR